MEKEAQVESELGELAERDVAAGSCDELIAGRSGLPAGLTAAVGPWLLAAAHRRTAAGPRAAGRRTLVDGSAGACAGAAPRRPRISGARRQPAVTFTVPRQRSGADERTCR